MHASINSVLSSCGKLGRTTACRAVPAFMCLLGASAVALGAGPGASGSGGGSTEVKIEKVGTKGLLRLTLTERAVERLGLKTTTVGEGEILRKQIVGGMFLPGKAIPWPTMPKGMARGNRGIFSFQASAPAQSEKPASTEAIAATKDGAIRVAFSAQEWGRWAKDKPVRVFKLAPRGGDPKGLAATSLKTPPIRDFKRSMLVQYFVLADQGHGLKPHERVRIEMQLADKQGKSKIVPYSAVHYDPNGGEWVYVETKPRTYQRHPIKIVRIGQGKALLKNGPPVGTKIVNVGVAMLHGIEVFRR